MAMIETSHDKVHQLCELLQSQAIEPAQKQVHELLAQAQRRADEILEQARLAADLITKQAQAHAKRQQEVVETSLRQAARQAIVSLRAEIEQTLLSDKVRQLAKSALAKEELIAQLMRSYIESIRASGISSDFSLLISQDANAPQLALSLGADLLSTLREGQLLQVLPGHGIKVQLHDQHITIDCTESALSELLGQYIRKELRERLFS